MKKANSWRISKKEAGTRLLQFLRENCPEASSVKALKRAIDGKCCMVNRQIETFSSYILKENDVVILDFSALEEKQSTSSLSILFEDEELLIVNKPSGLVCDPRSLPSVYSVYFLVHRLDKETTGVLILAKNAKAKEKMIELFKERKIQKVYLALVAGVMEKQEGTIDNYLGKKHAFQGQTVYGAVEKSKGLHAVTHWKCLKKGKGISLLACEPYTGRTHQLRVHLSGMGHPILGDTQYGKQKGIFRRQLLHAYSIAFRHPSTGKELKVIAPIPADFKKVLESL